MLNGTYLVGTLASQVATTLENHTLALMVSISPFCYWLLMLKQNNVAALREYGGQYPSCSPSFSYSASYSSDVSVSASMNVLSSLPEALTL